ncbi:hypothetical protein D3C87_1919350 [compost metagenome]
MNDSDLFATDFLSEVISITSNALRTFACDAFDTFRSVFINHALDTCIEVFGIFTHNRQIHIWAHALNTRK